MNFLADESVERQIVEQLRNEGYVVYSVLEMEPSIDDEMVLARANEQDALLITGDKDFGELVYRQGLIHTGVILVRLEGLLPETKGKIVATVVSDRSDELLNSFTVVSPGYVRVRHKE